jgi:predicted nucleic acid-binding protein
MCIIVDTNVVARVLFEPDDPDFHELHRMLVRGIGPRGHMVYGGRLRREYFMSDRVRRLLAVLRRAGRARAIPDTGVDAEEKQIRQLRICSSDDEHIIALARVGDVRLLCSDDKDLRDDFRDRRLIDKPRGKIYVRASQRTLMRHFCG